MARAAATARSYPAGTPAPRRAEAPGWCDREADDDTAATVGSDSDAAQVRYRLASSAHALRQFAGECSNTAPVFPCRLTRARGALRAIPLGLVAAAPAIA